MRSSPAEGRYQKVRQLGTGSLGPIFEARDLHLDRMVAVRELSQEVTDDPALLKRALERVEKMSAVSHPHVLTIHAVESRHQPPRFIVELLTGTTVVNLLAEFPVSPERVALLLGQALEGLQQLHHHGVLHGDLRPSQIFFHRNALKIGDFGRIALGGQQERDLESTRYASPEALDGTAPLTPAADLFTLGLLAYELTLGTERYLRIVVELLESMKAKMSSSESLPLWRKFHLSQATLPELREIDPSMPQPFSDVIARMLSKNPSDRPETCNEVLRELTAMRGWTAMFEAVRPPASHGPGDEPLDDLLRQLSPQRASVALVVIFLVGLTALFISRYEPGTPTDLTPETSSPRMILEAPKELLEGFTRLVDSDASISLRLSGGRQTLEVGDSLSFEISVPREGYASLFVVSSDGTVLCLYPNRKRQHLQIDAGERLELPGAKDHLLGIALTADLPTGEDHAFLLLSRDALTRPPLTHVPGGDWLWTFPFVVGAENPAVDFLYWVERSVEKPQTELTHLRYQVTAQKDRP